MDKEIGPEQAGHGGTCQSSNLTKKWLENKNVTIDENRYKNVGKLIDRTLSISDVIKLGNPSINHLRTGRR